MERILARATLLLSVIGVCALAVVPASGQAAAPFVIEENADTSPGIAVDAAGTAHIAWGSVSGPNHSITYCQVPRGATACVPATKKVIANSLNNFGTVQVLLKQKPAGLQVVLLYSACCGGGSGTIMRKSLDGGVTFPPPSFKVMNEPAGYSIFRSSQNALGSGAIVTNSAGTRIGFVGYEGESSADSPPDLSNGTSDPEREVLGENDVDWINSTTPFATQMGYLTNHLFTRFFNSGTTNYNIGGNWLHETKIDTHLTESSIANGPAGPYIAAITTVGHAFDYREIALYKLDPTGVAGAPIPLVQELDPAHGPTNMDLAQDDGGRLHLAWTDTGFDGKTYYEWSKDGVTWSPPTLIQLDPTKGGYDNRIAVAADGGGWIMSDSNGGGAIVLAPLDAKGDASPPARPVKPGPTPPNPNPPAPACPTQIKVNADAPAVVRSGGCFTGKAPTYKSTGSVRVGGVDLVPQGKSTLTVDTSAHTISSGGAKYEVRAGATILSKAAISWDLGKPITINGIGAFGVKLFGLDVGGKADMWFTKGEGRIQINLELPSPLDKVSANTVLRTTMTDGLIVDGFAVDGHDVPIGPVMVTKFNLAYSSGADTLEGAFSMKLPPGASDNVSGGLGLANGSFKHAELEIGPGVPPLPLPLFATPPITLNRIGAAASNDAKGFTMTGKIGLVAGGELAGFALVGVDGSLTLFVPSSRSYAQIRAQGDVKIVGVPLGGGFVQIRSDGPLTFGGSLGIDFSVIEASFTAAGGINLSNGDFYASGKAHFGVSLVVLAGTLDASTIISSRGVAACGAITGKVPATGLKGTIELGYQKEWGKDSELGGCEIDKYVPASLKGGSAMASGFGPSPFDPVARASQAPAGTLKLKAGDLAGVKVKGSGGRPGFTFAGPGGRTITVPANLTDPVIEGSISVIPVSADSVELQVKNPKGTWTVTADGAAPAVAQVLSAGTVPEPKTTASVRRKGSKRVLSVTTSNLGSQTMLVREILPDGAASELGKITGDGRKTMTFTPAIAAGGRRPIEAVILNGSKVTGTKRIASYIAPKNTRLAAPKRVTVTRKRTGRTTANLRWTSVTGAASYRVFVKGTDGRKEYFTTKRTVTRLAIPNVTFDDKLTITVQAIPAVGAPGMAKTASSRAVKLRKAAKKKAK